MKFDYKNKGVPKTDQTDRITSDINFIINSFGYDNVVLENEMMKNRFGYADLTKIPNDFKVINDIIINGQKSFEALPAEVRKAFNNNAIDFMNCYLSDDETDVQKCYFYGLKQKPIEYDIPKQSNNDVIDTTKE